jgi:hypothetical protein
MPAFLPLANGGSGTRGIRVVFSTYRRPERPGSGFGAARATTWG